MSDTNNLKVEYLSVDALEPYGNNARRHEDDDLAAIQASIRDFGFNDPIGIWSDHNIIVEGHGRLMAAKALGMTEVPCIRLDHLTDEQRKAYALAHNKTAELSDWDFDLLETELADIYDVDMAELGFDVEDAEASVGGNSEHGSLFDRFGVPPFSVLDTRQGYWKERKAAWVERIGDTGQARDNVDLLSISRMEPTKYNSASILDPVLSELVCRWFIPDTGKCFDCFAGDTVFGYVSAAMGNTFTGIELRQEQCDFNANATADLNATYICDDGRNVCQHIAAESQDLFFSCPPYFDLEVYSDLENDASNQSNYSDFYAIIDAAFTEATKCLKDGRFAVIVVGDVRNHDTGEYYDFPGDIKRTFKKAGLQLYNELILVDPVGTARLRAGGYMRTCKVAKVHQNVLVFYKGDTRNIKNIFPEIEVADESEDMEL